ncbi:MAG: alpha/beta fold hydrolase [Prevotella sp.]|nr:alpha/beta fold hydrolase [Prevotella sp.]
MQKQKKILFLHGFYASGSCVPAMALKEAFNGRAIVLTPDLPLHPADAVRLIRDICDKEKPDILVGNSCGSFYAQMTAPVIGVPALLGNPHFKMSDFLRERIGNHQYKSPRVNGKQDFTIDKQLISEFEEMEAHQFDYCNIYDKERVWGLFGEEDTLAHFEPLFLEHYTHSFHFPGGHTPTAEQFKTWYVPLIEKLINLHRDKEIDVSITDTNNV